MCVVLAILPAPAAPADEQLGLQEHVLPDVCWVEKIRIADSELLPTRYRPSGDHLHGAALHLPPAVRLAAVVEHGCLQEHSPTQGD